MIVKRLINLLFRTQKYRASSGVASLSDGRDRVQNFNVWYNTKHRHSKLNFVMPAQRHAGLDEMLLRNRQIVLEAAKAANPIRWSKGVRNCAPIGPVTLNPNDHAQPQIESVA